MAERMYSKEIAEAIKKTLDDIDFKYSFEEVLDGRKGGFTFGCGVNCKLKSVKYIIDVRSNSYIVYAISPINGDTDDKDGMAALADFICRVNYGLPAGNFELDLDDGEVRFKYYVKCPNLKPDNDIVMESVICPMIMFERYGNGLVNVIFAGADPKEESEKCEAKEIKTK